MIYPNEVTYFARTNFRNQNRKFGIKLDDRRRHMYVIGKTGVGKTELLKNMIIQDMENGHGVAYIDPNGDAVEELLECVPAHRINDVIYFNPADTDYPIAFNILENVEDEYKHLVSDGLMGVFTKIWANMWSARMEYILRNCILALLDVPGNTLLGIMRLLVDKEFRKRIIDKVKDPVVKTFWTEEYANYNDRFRTEAIAPIQNKVGQFLSSSIIRNIVGQTKSTIDPRKIMDEGKILLMNLSKGKIGEDNSALLGAMMVTKIQLAAMSRADIPEAERRDFFLYVDEFQNFATESFADILSEARKYRLGLVVGHQYIAQLSTTETTKVRDAVFGNVGTIVVFRVGAADAEWLVKEFEPYFTEEDLVNLNKYDVYLKLLINGVASHPFSATTLPPLSEGKKNSKNMEKVIKVSRERYANPKEEVEDKIIRWLNLEETFKEQAAMEKVDSGEVMYAKGVTVEKVFDKRKPNRDFKREETKTTVDNYPAVNEQPKEQLEATCDNCLEKTILTFRPQAHLNVFCKKCLKLFRQGQINLSQLKFHNLDIAIDTKKQTATITQSEKSLDYKPAEKESKPKVISEKISLAELNSQQPQNFKDAGGRSVKPGQPIRLQN